MDGGQGEVANERCTQERPLLRPVRGAQHLAACHYPGEEHLALRAQRLQTSLHPTELKCS